MSPEPLPDVTVQQTRRHLLLIERDVARRQTLYDALTRRGLMVYTAHSGEMALTVLGYERPDLILLDPALTDMSGAQLVERIRSFNAAIPILLLEDEGVPLPATQACLPRTMPHDRLFDEIAHWLSAGASTPHEPPAGTVLLIDDELRMRVIMQNLLELNGFGVLTAGSGEEGLVQLARTLPDAVILDVRMPGMDGLVVLKKIRETHPRLPVILVTQVDEEATREEAMRLGANGYVTKPFNFDGLKQVLREVIPSSTKSPVSSTNGSGSSG